MKKMIKRFLSATLVLALLLSIPVITQQLSNPITAEASTNTWAGRTPKYIFFFIGDGMTYPQITAASDYLGTLEYEGKKVESVNLEFTKFPAAGSATTYDSSSFCPDSASTATSMSTGFKTFSGIVNMDEQKKVKYETIAEKLKKQLGYKIGIVSSVPIDHATPAAFYAHQPSRGNYYEIGVELVNSNFDYFGGGGFQLPKGKKGDMPDVLELAKANGYTVANTKADILATSQEDKKVIAINPELIGGALPYEIDRKSGELSLADFTRKGIELLQNETGFFMMIEGGKIDWACHANDAMTTIQDTIAFDEAVQEAIKFHNKYPNDTLILVAGDHETGGLSIGFAGTGYSTYLDKLSKQTMSYEAFDKEAVAAYRTNKSSFESVLVGIKQNFGLITKTDVSAASNPGFVLTDYEYDRLKASYTLSMIDPKSRKLSEEENLLYGSYEPLTVTVTHILNNKAGIGWTSYSHTAIPVGVFAKGNGEALFNGYYDNTEIFIKLKALTRVK